MPLETYPKSSQRLEGLRGDSETHLSTGLVATAAMATRGRCDALPNAFHLEEVLPRRTRILKGREGNTEASHTPQNGVDCGEGTSVVYDAGETVVMR